MACCKPRNLHFLDVCKEGEEGSIKAQGLFLEWQVTFYHALMLPLINFWPLGPALQQNIQVLSLCLCHQWKAWKQMLATDINTKITSKGHRKSIGQFQANLHWFDSASVTEFLVVHGKQPTKLFIGTIKKPSETYSATIKQRRSISHRSYHRSINKHLLTCFQPDPNKARFVVSLPQNGYLQGTKG